MLEIYPKNKAKTTEYFISFVFIYLFIYILILLFAQFKSEFLINGYKFIND